ncbi:cholinephosphotransferase 1-like [Saccoglossus kowalevskii]|uniref:Choline/ethanolaminephosphotransferase 1-like n=1 Tax=Saccoglossus kowalevskii TaxID=10224 RepID=A0ABM0GWM3_SACKO|nr:PREDICTED: choline/ethanolaminephosphotransferase 1-like [Saccoglossus kowalevskii]
MAGILDIAQLKRLSEHKYSSHGTSITEPVMQPFWRWLVEKIPETIAPNTITSMGLLINILTSTIVYMYCPTATEEAPSWVYIQVALGLFAYQTLDAIDGKQARRTHTSSPLGELFDHGCDSVSTVYVGIATGCALQLGFHPGWLMYMISVGVFLFYTAHWQAYVSGELKFGKLDVTEAQFLIIFIYLLSGIFGPLFWATRIPVLGLELKHVAVLGSSMAAVMSGFMHFSAILSGGIGKNGSTVAGTSTIAPVIHIGVVLLLQIMIMAKSPSHLYENNTCLYLLFFGIVASKVTNKLVVAHMTKSEMYFLDTALIAPGLLFFNQYFDTPVSEYYLLWVALILASFDILRYSTIVCTQICDHLGIYCFDITKTKTPKDTDEVKKVVTRSQTANAKHRSSTGTS